MSIHGACFDNGQSGNCNLDCEVYIAGDCTVHEEVWERCMEEYNTMRKCHVCNYRTPGYLCDHKGRNRGGDIEQFFDEGTVPDWCPINAQTKRGTNDMNDKKFDFDQSTAQVKDNAMSAFETAKNVIVQMQQGNAVLAAIKASLKKAPGCPDSLRLLLETSYGDMVVGLILQTVAPIMTGNPHVMKAVKAANIAGAVEVSNQFTFIQDAIEGAIEQIPGLADLKNMAGAKLDQVVDEAKGVANDTNEFTVCPNCENMFRESSMTHGLCRPCYNGLSDEEQAEMAGV